jgi:hypothetical protein
MACYEDGLSYELTVRFSRQLLPRVVCQPRRRVLPSCENMRPLWRGWRCISEGGPITATWGECQCALRVHGRRCWGLADGAPNIVGGGGMPASRQTQKSLECTSLPLPLPRTLSPSCLVLLPPRILPNPLANGPESCDTHCSGTYHYYYHIISLLYIIHLCYVFYIIIILLFYLYFILLFFGLFWPIIIIIIIIVRTL